MLRASRIVLSEGKTTLTAARAVSKAEAPNVIPATESTTTTLMPWKGWFDRLMKDRLSPGMYETYRKTFHFRPDDKNDLLQQPYPATKIPTTDDGSHMASVRYPSPGSQDPVRIPTLEEGEDPYFTAHYVRDTTRRYLDPAFPNPELEQLKIDLLPQDDSRVEEAKAKLDEGPKSSPGNKGRFATGVSDFDTTGGMRATMSTNHEAVNASLDSYMPDHLPYPDWWDKQDEIVQWYKERGLPVPLGSVGYGRIPTHGRVARW